MATGRTSRLRLMLCFLFVIVFVTGATGSASYAKRLAIIAKSTKMNKSSIRALSQTSALVRSLLGALQRQKKSTKKHLAKTASKQRKLKKSINHFLKFFSPKARRASFSAALKAHRRRLRRIFGRRRRRKTSPRKPSPHSSKRLSKLSKKLKATSKAMKRDKQLLKLLDKQIVQSRRILHRLTFGIVLRRNTFRSVRQFIRRRTLPKKIITKCGRDARVWRKLDGSCNNLRFYRRGAAGEPFRLQTNRGMEATPSGGDRPSTRHVSNIVHGDHVPKWNKRGMSEMVTFFGQFLDHNYAEFETEKNKAKVERFHIKVPKNDPVKRFHDAKEIQFVRTHKKKSSRGFAAVNELPSYIDVAAAYGASKDVVNQLRDLTSPGFMATSTRGPNRNMLPQNDGFFFSGDPRVNENPQLIIMHTLFVRSHNTLALEVKFAFPHWTNDRVFEMARKINGALMQSIVYYEFLPAVLGRTIPYARGNPDATLSDEFSVCAFRVGHTLVNSELTFISSKGKKTTRKLGVTFLKPDIFDKLHVDDGIRGMMRTKTAEVDVQITDELRNKLFANMPDSTPLDLVAINLQRGRDHRLPSYVELRKKFRLRPIRTFDDIPTTRKVRALLKKAYGTVDKIDAFTGGLAEKHVRGGSLGMLFRKIWVLEFMRLRAGDRFYFEKRGAFKSIEIRKIPTLRKLMTGRLRGTAMRHILLANTDLKPSEVRNPWKVSK